MEKVSFLFDLSLRPKWWNHSYRRLATKLREIIKEEHGVATYETFDYTLKLSVVADLLAVPQFDFDRLVLKKNGFAGVLDISFFVPAIPDELLKEAVIFRTKGRGRGFL